MNDTTVTVVGTVCSEVRYSHSTAETTPTARFQIRTTPRRYDKRTGTWSDGDPSYYTATCFRTLADHVASSMGVGDPVVATGRLRINRWRRGEDHMVTAELDVQAIGHDLRWGTTVYRRSNPPTRIPGPGRHRNPSIGGSAGAAAGIESETETERSEVEAVPLVPAASLAAAAQTSASETADTEQRTGTASDTSPTRLRHAAAMPASADDGNPSSLPPSNAEAVELPVAA